MIGSFIFTETSPAAPGTAASSAAVAGAANYAAAGVAQPLDDFDAIDIIAELVGATGGTLDVYVQYSPDQGTHWYELVHFPQLAAAAGAIRYRAPVSLNTNLTAPLQTGRDLSPNLATNVIVNGAWSDRMRLLMVAGSGTSAGAAVVVKVTGQRHYNRERG